MQKNNNSIANLLDSAYLLILLLIFTIVQSCSVTTQEKPDLSAIPHAKALPTTELSDEDKAKLQKASGKIISTINTVDLQNMLLASSDQLYIYIFWDSKCQVCLDNIGNLQTLSTSFGQDKMKVITINIGDTLKNANLAVRSENIAFETYQLRILDQKWSKLIDDSWDGSVPAIIMVNKSEDVFLKYYKSMDENELEAIIQTLII